MRKYPIIGGSVFAVVLILFSSFSNIVGYQSIQESNQKILTADTNEKQLLFQTIVDIANTKDIQRVIQGSELIGKRFFNPSMKYSAFIPIVLTKRSLNLTYQLGLKLLKIISTSKVLSMMKQNQVNNRGLLKELTAVVEKDVALKNEMIQLSSLSCDCENKSYMNWSYPVLCTVLYLLFVPTTWIVQFGYWDGYIINKWAWYVMIIIAFIAEDLKCSWFT
jgi:hypothetical protein